MSSFCTLTEKRIKVSYSTCFTVTVNDNQVCWDPTIGIAWHVSHALLITYFDYEITFSVSQKQLWLLPYTLRKLGGGLMGSASEGDVYSITPGKNNSQVLVKTAHLCRFSKYFSKYQFYETYPQRVGYVLLLTSQKNTMAFPWILENITESKYFTRKRKRVWTQNHICCDR